ncbi:protein kinase [Streptomyces sp. NPDC092296]|uniref:protein kinase domain-containing protein n=1 Tax=Streptomyces sp. NPDC092296 TaxID=3366012 RepID=UPI00382E15F5
MAQTQHTGDGDAPGGGRPRDESPREQPPHTASGPQDAELHGGRTAAGVSDTPHTPVAGHGSGGFGRPAFGAPGTPGQGVDGDFGTVGEGRYHLNRRLGRGGMAEVFAAEDLRLGRTVAVKLLRTELAQDDVARLRFTREAHAVAALNHHAVVAVYDTGEEELPGGESMPYIVMELVEGRTVRELLLAEEAPPVDQALIIIAGVLEALAYSHRHGIVHRDIKPANVIITTTGAVKVMDFGIARALTGAASTMTQTGMVMGTPQYLSPEQALGKPVDHRSDLYATGCMLYELLTLRPPFTGETPLSVVYQHVQDNPVPPSQANHRVPPQLDGLVLRSLAKDPDDRFQTADEFRAHAQQALREMHGAATGSGYPAGQASAAGPIGLRPGRQGTPPAGSDALTQRFSTSTPPMGTATTALDSGYRPYEPPPGGPGGGDEPPHRARRNPLLWLALVVAVAVAAVAAVFTLNGDPDDARTTGPTTTTSPTAPDPDETGGPTTPSVDPALPSGGDSGLPSGSGNGLPQSPPPATESTPTEQPTTTAPTTPPPPVTSTAPTTPPPPVTSTKPSDPPATDSGGGTSAGNGDGGTEGGGTGTGNTGGPASPPAPGGGSDTDGGDSTAGDTAP